MSEETKNFEIEKLREHISKCLLDKINNFRISTRQSQQYQIALKTWCITLFMASVGFCLTKIVNENYSKIYNLLPFFPVLMFWFLHAYRDYLTELYLKAKHLNEIENILSEIYNYSYKDLKKISKDSIPKKFEAWTEQGKFKPCRGLKKTFYNVPQKMFLHYENLIFFGMMCLVWTVALIFFYVTKK